MNETFDQIQQAFTAFLSKEFGLAFEKFEAAFDSAYEAFNTSYRQVFWVTVSRPLKYLKQP